MCPSLPSCETDKSKNNQKTKKMNYRFISRKQIAMPTFAEIAAAKKVTNFEDILKANRSIGEYVFISNPDVTKFFSGAESLEITLEKIPSGTLVNRAKAVVNGHSYRLRCYGVKGSEMPEKSLSKAEIEKLSFGYCESDGETVSEEKTDPTTGEIVSVPVFYVKLA